MCMQIIASNSISIFIILTYILFFAIQYIGNVCHADINRLQGHGFNISPQKLHILYQTAPTHFLDITTYNKRGNLPADEYIKLVGVIIENRFIATGTILDIKRVSKGVQKFTMKIKETKQFKDYPSFGGNYLGKEVEVFSEIGIPPSFRTGVEAFVLLRVSGDEWGQYLFLVEVIENEEKD